MCIRDSPYGFPKSSLTCCEYEDVRMGTFFVLKTAELASVAHAHGVAFGVENLKPWEGHVSLFGLP
eukprot:7723075-Heterocapsa_arctica.AAC.1